ncbi:hypothetical protein GCM10023216_28110 [Isoptericola chiayiensis]|uniref:Alpha/beta hydrolase n=1 Tax=Isoptericola chiayiensis TaxID=579446 RepID=A0ABP8YPG8_9MICO|nr:alpha/beta fold hydrolase [Isoptericola chiayiensis]NOW02268.1 pimeloyl-ACP methyl ester carboxylesterase [Isoptericola chiayiensis]
MSTTGTTQQTIVLVHGAFADSSSWNGSIPALQAAGHRVVAVANPLRGLAYDAAYLRSVLDGIDGPVVVAGHSYGGTVMSVAADGDPDVTALVYVASFLPEIGESTGELAAKFPGARLGDALEAVPAPLPEGGTGDDLSIRQEEFRTVFAADVPEQTAALMAATQRPIIAQALADPLTAAAWRSIPSWSLVARQDLAIPLESERFMAERAGARTVEVDASHAVTVSRPDAVTDIILDAARTTAPVALPDPVRRYFELAPTDDHAAFLALFADSAVVEDESRTHTGIDAVRAWRTGSVPVRYEITDVARDDGSLVVTATITGDFPGSPFAGLRYEFDDLTDDRIHRLRIRA